MIWLKYLLAYIGAILKFLNLLFKTIINIYICVIKKVERDILAIGTPTTLLAYDVENNSDLFYKEVILILFLLLSDDDDGSLTWQQDKSFLGYIPIIWWIEQRIRGCCKWQQK